MFKIEPIWERPTLRATGRSVCDIIMIIIIIIINLPAVAFLLVRSPLMRKGGNTILGVQRSVVVLLFLPTKA
jgi:hypothetical protein